MKSNKFRSRLARSRQSLSRGLGQLFTAKKLDDSHLDDLEDLLISGDVGVSASQRIVTQVKRASKAHRVSTVESLNSVIQTEMLAILKPCENLPEMTGHPYVMLVVGVNGVGKTTSVAKIAKHFQQQGKSVLLAAADTFRAAAVEQLHTWAERMDIPVIAQHQGADAAAVAHDALTSAMSRNIDLLLIDTAGRQHTHSDLMEQLKKIKRVLAKVDPNTPQEIMQVLDATTGQNAVSQLRHFDSAVSVNSLCLTKLDGTAKGGVVVAIADEFKLPIRFIGIGEGADDLRPFSAESFVDALLLQD
ncbi:MAG: signal recognition particle-docking protein FtsY [Arenicellales bacterium]|nr:signal recognition particle-docking protein FtsY [Arenicellales bacterium]